MTDGSGARSQTSGLPARFPSPNCLLCGVGGGGRGARSPRRGLRKGQGKGILGDGEGEEPGGKSRPWRTRTPSRGAAGRTRFRTAGPARRPVGEGRAAGPASQGRGGEHIPRVLSRVPVSPASCVSGSCTRLVCTLNGNMQEGKGSCHCTPKGLRICKPVPSLPPPLGSPASPVTVASRDLKTEASGRKCVACSKCHGQEVAGPDLNPGLLWLFTS